MILKEGKLLGTKLRVEQHCFYHGFFPFFFFFYLYLIRNTLRHDFNFLYLWFSGYSYTIVLLGMFLAMTRHLFDGRALDDGGHRAQLVCAGYHFKDLFASTVL